jgi:hypothetical protein
LPPEAGWLSSQFRQPVVQNRNTALFYRREGDAHPRRVARIRDSSLGDEQASAMRDADGYFRPGCERHRCLNKAAERAQVLSVCSDLGVAVDCRYLDSGNEWKSSRASNGGTSIFLKQFIPNCTSAV